MSGPIVDVTKYGADATGVNDSTTAIQRALDETTSGVIFLPAGTFRVRIQTGKNYALRISRSNVVLRGAGADKTFLVNDTTNYTTTHSMTTPIRRFPTCGCSTI